MKPTYYYICLLTLATLGSANLFATPLTDAINKVDLATVQKLIADGVDVNEKVNGTTPLHDAAKVATNDPDERAKRLAIVTTLLAHGANVNAKDNEGDTPLHSIMSLRSIYAHYADIAIVKALIEAGANLNAKGNDGYTPLFLAAFSKSHEILQELIKAGANVNEKDADGTTPLHGAYDIESAKALIAAGADVNAEGKGKATPLHFMAMMRSRGIDSVKALIAAGANVNAKANSAFMHVGRAARDWTALHSAAHFGHDGITKTLIEAGANVNAVAVSDKGETPLDLAHHDEEVKEVLLAAGAKKGSELKK